MKKLFFTLLCVYIVVCIGNAQVLYSTTEEGGKYNGGAIVTYEPSVQALNAAKSFYIDGDGARSNLTKAADGKLYGTTKYGGGYFDGTIYSYDPASGTYAHLHDFKYANGYGPEGDLVYASDGKLYGMTSEGGLYDRGVIYAYDPATATFTKLFDFSPFTGEYPGGKLTQATDGKLYGMTNEGGLYDKGTIFSYDPATATFTRLHDFDGSDGSYPHGSLTQVTDGTMYGMAGYGGDYDRGVIFSFKIATASYTKVYDFNYNDGANPYASLLQVGTNLYGTTEVGGAADAGVVFSFDTSSHEYQTLVDFTGGNGYYPEGDLFKASDGKLYGTANGGGAYGYGVLFSYDLLTNEYLIVQDFDYDNTGAYPYAGVVQDGNKLYGATWSGGPINGAGVIFSYDIVGATYATVKLFGADEDGNSPNQSLLKAANGKLYGMTAYGGANDGGVIFSYDAENDIFNKLYDFNFNYGVSPYGNLMQSTTGKLYGMTSYGGVNDDGVLFSYDIASSTYSVLHEFDEATGDYPYGSLTQVGGKLYGMTNYGGDNLYGVIFSYDTASGDYVVEHNFDNTHGSYPEGSLTLSSDGNLLYGMANYGGPTYDGVLFSFDPSGRAYNVLHEFNSTTDGSDPSGGVIEVAGKLYGMTRSGTGGGSYSEGVLFSYDLAGDEYTNLHAFNGLDGAEPYGDVFKASDGNLYGLTYEGGAFDLGVVFSYNYNTNTYQKLKDFDTTKGAFPNASFIEIPCNNPKTFYKDADGDGYGDLNNSIATSCTQPDNYVKNSDDCDDVNAGNHPGAKEVCDGIDNNCNGVIDEDCPIPNVRIYDASVYEGNSGQKNLKFRVALSDTAYRKITIHYKTIDNSATTASGDYVAANGTLTFMPGDKRQFVTVKINGDALPEADETFKVKLNNPEFAKLKDATAFGTILNNDGVVTIAGLSAASSSIAAERAVVVAPNPVTNVANIRLIGFSGNTTMQVVSLQGQLLKTIKTNGITSQQLSVANIASGTYFLTVSDEDGFKETVKLVIVH